MLIVASADAVARRAPSGLNFAEVMPRACALEIVDVGRYLRFFFADVRALTVDGRCVGSCVGAGMGLKLRL